MRAAVHVLTGIGLFVLAAGLGWLTANVERSPDAKLPMRWVRFVTLGSDRSRQDWLLRLRLSYGVMAVIVLLFAISLWLTA
jgi:hypothetical protein